MKTETLVLLIVTNLMLFIIAKFPMNSISNPCIYYIYADCVTEYDTVESHVT